ncbi:MAG: hypothetical protein QOJ65_1450 [Fimbriimonadaceae bacterium]|nr:hypothetical protein [Fimbriimonadaceae bacterium]
MRKLQLLAAAVVGALAVTTMNRAYAVGTVPNASRVTVAVPALSESASFAFATMNSPIQVLASGIKGNVGVAEMTVTVMLEPNVTTWGGLAWVSHGIRGTGINRSQYEFLYSGTLNNSSFYVDPNMVNVVPDNPASTDNISVYLVATRDSGNKYTRYRVRNNLEQPQTVVIVQMW